MNYNLEFYEEYLKKVNKFKGLGWVGNYLELKKKPNFWTILEYGKVASSRQKSSHEIRYSKMLRWLLDPNENHDLGNQFAYKLMQRIDKDIEYNHSLERNKLIKAKAEALNNIDILYKDLDQDVLIVIELKQFTSEHESTGYDSQLDKYEATINKFVEEVGRDMLVYYVYLTPQGEDPSNENWTPIGYKEIIEIIDEIEQDYLLKSNHIYKSDIEKIMDDFKDDLQRTMDVFEKDISYVRNNFSKEEIKFTSILYDEINDEVQTGHIGQLRSLENDIEGIEEMILLINEYNYTQDHTPNAGVRQLMRKIFNYLSQGPDLDLDLGQVLTAQERRREIKPQLVDKYGLDFDELSLTSGKGQGIYLYNKSKTRKIYFSGDKDGYFPNDSIQVLENLEKDKTGQRIMNSGNIKNKMFEVEYDLISQDKIKINKKDEKIKAIISEVISFESFMESYLMKEIKVLSDFIN